MLAQDLKPKTFEETHKPVNQKAGVLFQKIKTPSNGKLTIETSAGADYLVQLLKAGTKKAIVGIYLKGGKTLTVDVPLGNYDLVYAAGKIWYGLGDRFGPPPMTSYSKADKPFEFKADSEGMTSHWAVELILQENGNLGTTKINASQFGE